MKKILKRSIIKEELFALTGDTQSAVILNQFIYWSERVKDFNQFIMEEIRIGKGEKPNTSPKHGWIYKSMEELKDEIMLTCSTITIGRKLSKIVENGWLDRRTNPKYKWDKTYQYRVNLNKILSDLLKIDYFLQDYRIDLKCLVPSNLQKTFSSSIQREEAIPDITTKDIKKINNNSTKIQSTLKGTSNKNNVVVKTKNSQNDKIIESPIANSKDKDIYPEEDAQTAYTADAVCDEIPKELTYSCQADESPLTQDLCAAENPKDRAKEDSSANYPQKEYITESGGSTVKELIEKYSCIINPADICRILGPDPSDEEIEKMKDALEYIDSQYIRKGRKITNMGGLLRCAFRNGYKTQPLDPIAIKHQKRLEQERAEWEKEMSKPPASKKSVEKGLQIMRDILFGGLGSGFTNAPAYS